MALVFGRSPQRKSLDRAHRGWSAAWAMVLGGSAVLAGCGGRDDGRPSTLAAGDASVDDPCRAADGLVFQNILNFETTPVQCDSAFLPRFSSGSCLYFNYDSDHDPAIDPNHPPPDSETIQHSPLSCDLAKFDPPPWKCVLPSGEIADSMTQCAFSNANGPTIPIEAIDGDGGTSPDAGGGRCGVSSKAMHVITRNLSICMSEVTQRQGWGASLSVTFFSSGGTSISSFDASHFDGLSFWLRKGAGPGGNAILAGVRDPYTAAFSLPDAGAATSTTDAGTSSSCGISPTGATTTTSTGYCNSSNPSYCGQVGIPCRSADGTALPFDGVLHPCVPDSEKCDPFGAAVLLTDEWRFVKIPFTRMVQKGYGMPTPSGRLDAAHITGLQFGLAPGDWDFWVDDVAFYRQGP